MGKFNIKNKAKAVGEFILDRMPEPSTWQGIGFLASLFTAKYNGLDWGSAAALGGTVSALIKTIQKG